MTNLKRYVLTIGHSNHSLETLVALLRRHSVTALADVRSVPYSRFCPQFNKTQLRQSIKENGIKYVFLGQELGARSDNPACYFNGRVQYTRLACTALFKAGIERVVNGAEKHRIALMCAEREPLECHRTLLIARALVERGIQVEHILPNGRLEAHSDTMTRLLGIVGLPDSDLFRSRDELISEALAKQEDRIAYVDEDSSHEVAEKIK